MAQLVGAIWPPLTSCQRRPFMPSATTTITPRAEDHFAEGGGERTISDGSQNIIDICMSSVDSPGKRLGKPPPIMCQEKLAALRVLRSSIARAEWDVDDEYRDDDDPGYRIREIYEAMSKPPSKFCEGILGSAI
eukprot:3741328-Amphidinium_carterae.3